MKNTYTSSKYRKQNFFKVLIFALVIMKFAQIAFVNVLSQNALAEKLEYADDSREWLIKPQTVEKNLFLKNDPARIGALCLNRRFRKTKIPSLNLFERLRRIQYKISLGYGRFSRKVSI